MYKIQIAFGMLLLAGCGVSAQTVQNPVEWVHEGIGTAGEGQTFPATGLPFAMTQWTPQTRVGSEKCVAPYYDGDTRIQGFRGSHFLSGSCTQDYGSVTLMPVSGELKLTEAERASAFERSSEVRTPYRYAVTLKDYGIDAEVTGKLRAGLMRFRSQQSGRLWILVQGNSGKGDGQIRIDVTAGEVQVSLPVRRLYAGQGQLAGFSSYAVVRFDHPFQVGGAWSGALRRPGAVEMQGEAGAPGVWIGFDLKAGEAVEARIGTSFTSTDEARSNLQSEIPGWDFDAVANEVRQAWNRELSRVQIAGSSEEKAVLYTALYHSMLLPRVFSDVDGSYPGFAGEGRTEHAQGFVYYDDFSLWDTFRALHPLFTLLDPARERDMVKSLIAKGEQGGFLPIFPAWNSYTQEMTGDHAVAVIGDAWIKGIRGFDMDAAWKLMRKNATELPATHEQYVDGRGRRALDSYLRYGYIPLEDPVKNAYHGNEQVSRTLDYAYDDFVLGEVAESLGKKEDAELFHRRGQNYRNVIDPETGYARGRHADGSWVTPFDPGKKATYITEGLPSQFTFFVPHDIPGLLPLLGGRQAFMEKLDRLFAQGEYDHGNEPSHHLAYVYVMAGEAWKTQQKVREILTSQYHDSTAGLAGNDDCGQMSAWYVFSALGFYPVTPGTTKYWLGAPLFEEATVQMGSGARLHLLARGAAAGKQYIRSVRLNGVLLQRAWLTHEELERGGELEFVMSGEPVTNWP